MRNLNNTTLIQTNETTIEHVISSWDAFSAQKWGLHRYTDYKVIHPMLEYFWPVMLSLVACYIAMVKCCKPKGHTNAKWIRQRWNAALAAFSLITGVHLFSHIIYQIVTQGPVASVCQAVSDGPIGFWTTLFVLSKVVELGDTVLLLWSGRSISFLHAFHHSTVLPFCWYLLQYRHSVGHWFSAMNCLVHSVMYGYFCINDAFDDAIFRRDWGIRITTIQCLQFVMGLTVVAIATYTKAHDETSCASNWESIGYSTLLYASYLVLFLRFAEEKYGIYARLSHALWQRQQKKNEDGSSAIMPWQRTDLALSERFEHATKMIVMLAYGATKQELMTIYGAYKHVQSGPISDDVPEPQDDIKARFKYQGRKNVKNMSIEEAQLAYIEILDKLHQRSLDSIKNEGPKRNVVTKSQQQQQDDLYSVKIAGVGGYLPKEVVYNHQLEKEGGLPPGSLDQTRLGVKERRRADMDNGENMVQNAARAIREACANAGVALEDLDLIVGGFGIHQVIPDDACLVQRELGLGESGIRAFSVHATCFSAVVALDVAGALMRDGRYRCVAIFSSITGFSKSVQKDDLHTAGLFGDGTAAMVLKPSVDESAIHACHMETYGIGADTCMIPGGGCNRPSTHPEFNELTEKFHMDGEGVVRLASKYMSGVLNRFVPGLHQGLDNLKIPGTDKTVSVDWVIAHQASGLALDSLSLFGWPEDRVLRTLHKFGNTISASIPLTLWDGIQSGKIKRGHTILICGTSAGVSLGGMLLTY
eukprot:CAMPEP_0118688390 /NCGR_PEP_ID=MMETSP0800-20121206/8892_1 /TAXON_ID=210618 ORGANISM="Striatella unipunctata, Strain CCMP2910" /NCGR_SAMPLE_ID=MMETSP0800 /ASSEMBLY_ACC=CAM_ASM_000638 /LENGTH=757 /DNA_ID=CAMNT_0006585641 /DNA_START=84 /DNA_END=2357 /DNA_ORIENTATION=-